MNDRRVVASQINRAPRSVVEVVARCHLGLPTVTKVPPHLDDGTPFPTTYWLTCPLATRRIGRLEAAGGVKSAEQRVLTDSTYGAAFHAAMARYEEERNQLIVSGSARHMPSGGVGGSHRGVKCLHAHYADHAAGNMNPVGAEASELVEPLDCAAPCVVADGQAIVRNPDWVEP